MRFYNDEPHVLPEWGWSQLFLELQEGSQDATNTNSFFFFYSDTHNVICAVYRKEFLAGYHVINWVNLTNYNLLVITGIKQVMNMWLCLVYIFFGNALVWATHIKH